MNTNDLRIMRAEGANGKEVLKIYTPYNESFVSRIRMISGRYWNREEKCWEVPTQNIDLVRTLMKECYGYTDETSEDEKVPVTIEFIEEYKRSAYEQLIIFGKSIGRVRGRDTGAVLSPDVTLLYGDVNSGGSRNHPCMVIKKGTVLRLDSVSENVLEMDAPSFIRIVDVDGIQVEELEKNEEGAVDVYTEPFESNNEVNEEVTDDNNKIDDVTVTDENKDGNKMNTNKEVRINEDDFERVADKFRDFKNPNCRYDVCYLPETGEIYTGDLLFGNSWTEFHQENSIEFPMGAGFQGMTSDDLKNLIKSIMKNMDFSEYEFDSYDWAITGIRNETMIQCEVESLRERLALRRERLRNSTEADNNKTTDVTVTKDEDTDW